MVACEKTGESDIYIAYMGSWTEDDQIKQTLSVRINSTALIPEMLFGDLSGADLVFGFRKPEDLTLQDRFCIAIIIENDIKYMTCRDRYGYTSVFFTEAGWVSSSENLRKQGGMSFPGTLPVYCRGTGSLRGCARRLPAPPRIPQPYL